MMLRIDLPYMVAFSSADGVLQKMSLAASEYRVLFLSRLGYSSHKRGKRNIRGCQQRLVDCLTQTTQITIVSGGSSAAAL